MRRALVLTTLLLAGCPEADSTTTFCADLAAEQPSCMDGEAVEACKDAEAQCHGEIVVMESCPLQFGCPAD